MLANTVFPDTGFASMPQGSLSAQAPHLQLAPASPRTYIQARFSHVFLKSQINLSPKSLEIACQLEPHAVIILETGQGGAFINKEYTTYFH